jgi:hypothetical protein
VRTYINRMTIRQNNWTLGTFCETRLLSHFSYEERELVEPLARLGFY